MIFIWILYISGGLGLADVRYSSDATSSDVSLLQLRGAGLARDTADTLARAEGIALGNVSAEIMEHQSGTGDRVSFCADVDIVAGKSATKSLRVNIALGYPTGTYRCGDEGNVDKSNWDKASAGELAEVDDWFFVWAEGRTLVVERLDGDGWEINLGFTCNVCPTGMPDGLAPPHPPPPPCVFSDEWRLRITHVIGGHYTGSGLLALQELEVHAHDESGQEALLNRYYVDEKGVYGNSEGLAMGPPKLFDQDLSKDPLVDRKCVVDKPAKKFDINENAYLESPYCDFGTLAWGYAKPACITEFRFQTAKSGWWNCWNKHCGDPVRWVLEAEKGTEWVPVMRQATDYTTPIGRAEFTPWIPVAYSPGGEEQTDQSTSGRTVKSCEEILVFVGDSESQTVNIKLGDEYPIGVYECGHEGNVDKTSWNWGIAGELADSNHKFFISMKENEILVERLDGNSWGLNLAFTCNVHSRDMSKNDCPRNTAVIAPGIHTAYIEG